MRNYFRITLSINWLILLKYNCAIKHLTREKKVLVMTTTTQEPIRTEQKPSKPKDGTSTQHPEETEQYARVIDK
tara:strand:- start:1681 stop:1902 length:222 start_codon:yes stop_codon:yes gene_type:complete